MFYLCENREKPLALYIFSNDKNVLELLLKQTSSGGVVVNDVLMHFMGMHFEKHLYWRKHFAFDVSTSLDSLELFNSRDRKGC